MDTTRNLTAATVMLLAALTAGCGDQGPDRVERATSRAAALPRASVQLVTPSEARTTATGRPAEGQSCPFAPDLVQRMIDSGQPLPRCVRVARSDGDDGARSLR